MARDENPERLLKPKQLWCKNTRRIRRITQTLQLARERSAQQSLGRLEEAVAGGARLQRGARARRAPEARAAGDDHLRALEPCGELGAIEPVATEPDDV